MITINASNLSEAWENSFCELYKKGFQNLDDELYRDESVLIEVKDPMEKRYNKDYPSSEDLLKEYNNYIINGGNQGNVLDEHAMYHKRLFGKETITNNQVDFIINLLKKNPTSKRAQANLWDCSIDQTASFTPCLQIIWVRVLYGKVELHAHMRANDAYKKALMNMNIFTTLQNFIANQLGLRVGRYIHYVDSFHFHNEDKEAIDALHKKLCAFKYV
jgi:thymidylate synthase